MSSYLSNLNSVGLSHQQSQYHQSASLSNNLSGYYNAASFGALNHLNLSANLSTNLSSNLSTQLAKPAANGFSQSHSQSLSGPRRSILRSRSVGHHMPLRASSTSLAAAPSSVVSTATSAYHHNQHLSSSTLNLNQVPLNVDPNPIVIRRKPAQPVRYQQNVISKSNLYFILFIVLERHFEVKHKFEDFLIFGHFLYKNCTGKIG